MINLRIDTNPLPKARPRFSNGHAYTPEKTRDYEELIAHYASFAARQQSFLNDECLLVEIDFYRKGKRLADVDNLAKAVLDACNSILWKDDKQIRQLNLRVFYEAKDPCVLIQVSEL